MTEPEPDRAATVSRPGRAFDDFYREHAPELHRAVTLAIGSSDLAREAVDEAMTRAYARWSSVGTYDRPAAWVYRVAINWSTSRFRKRRREILDPFAPGSSTEGSVPEHLGTDPALARALACLSVEHRSVVVLRYLLDWSEAETSIALGVSPGTVKSRLSRALARLADELRPPSSSQPRSRASDDPASNDVPSDEPPSNEPPSNEPPANDRPGGPR